MQIYRLFQHFFICLAAFFHFQGQANVLNLIKEGEFHEMDMPVNSVLQFCPKQCPKGFGFAYFGSIVAANGAKVSKRFQLSKNKLVEKIEACANGNGDGICKNAAMHFAIFFVSADDNAKMTLEMDNNFKTKLEYLGECFEITIGTCKSEVTGLKEIGKNNKYEDEEKMNGAFLADFIGLEFLGQDMGKGGKIMFFKNSGCNMNMSTLEWQPEPSPTLNVIGDCKTTIVEVIPALVESSGQNGQIINDYAIRVGCVEGTSCTASSFPDFMRTLEQWIKENADSLKEWTQGPFNLAQWKIGQKHWLNEIEDQFQYYSVPWKERVSMLQHECKGKGKFLTATKQSAVMDKGADYDWKNDFDSVKNCEPPKLAILAESEKNSEYQYGEQIHMSKENVPIGMTIAEGEGTIKWESTKILAHKFKFGLTEPTRILGNGQNWDKDIFVWGRFVGSPNEGYAARKQTKLEAILRFPTKQQIGNPTNEAMKKIKVEFTLTMQTFTCDNGKYNILLPRFAVTQSINGKKFFDQAATYTYEGNRFDVPEDPKMLVHLYKMLKKDGKNVE